MLLAVIIFFIWLIITKLDYELGHIAPMIDQNLLIVKQYIPEWKFNKESIMELETQQTHSHFELSNQIDPSIQIFQESSFIKQYATTKDCILLLSPLARFYREYWDNLLQLTYPHEFIDIGFLVPRTKEGDNALQHLKKAIEKNQKSPTAFRSATILRQDFESFSSQNERDRHAFKVQKERRKIMSMARNSLLSLIRPHTRWVFWMDSDITETPNSIIQDMISHDKSIIVANCYQRYEGGIRPYDYNSWRESEAALYLASKMDPEEIIVEGYAEIATYRRLMAYLYREIGDKDHEIPLEGVGGCALLVNATVHRDGAIFPPFPFYHLMETEGFAKMANRLGYQSFGLPNYLVFHYNE